MRHRTILSLRARLTGYGFTIAAPWACSAPARLRAKPLVWCKTYRSWSGRTSDRSITPASGWMWSTTAPASVSARMTSGMQLVL
ncbi:MAG: hypothetical protein DMF79_15545 [Acidobacteria bacterium]|nr:MAG: hypothetical protein DMF79_15545 [Acidobacteriota bacterium]